MPTIQKDVYKRAEPDVQRLKNKVMDVLRSVGGSAIIQFPEWMTGVTPQDFRTRIIGNIKTQDKQVMWRARGQSLCTMKLGSRWLALKIVGPNDDSLTFEMSSSFDDKKETFEKVDAKIIEQMLENLLERSKIAVKEIVSARKAYVKV